ncbi:MAG TPA: ArsR family transcriptional regulator [Symbiobacteriaceae bacterium]|jgi:hypothetical protein
MQKEMVQTPVSLLLDPDLTAAAKVLWLAIRANSEPVTPTRLAAGSGLTLATIRNGLAQLAATGWYAPAVGAIEPAPSADTVSSFAGARVSIPAGLLPEPRLRPQAKLLYGLLQTLPAFRGQSGEFTYTTLSAIAHVSFVTVKQAVRELAGSGWIQVSQTNQVAPVRFTLRNPELERSAAEAALAMRRLQEAEFRGEAIMREYLSLLIDSDEFEDNARPGFLVNPLTDERMELDRYYPAVVAFEFNGAQHFRPTERFPSEKGLAMQQARDLMKEALCARRGVRLVVIKGEDLSLGTMQQKVGALLPLRDLRTHGELVEALEKLSKSYRG